MIACWLLLVCGCLPDGVRLYGCVVGDCLVFGVVSGWGGFWGLVGVVALFTPFGTCVF